MATILRQPLFSPRVDRVWLQTPHGEGTRGSPSTLLVVNPPVRQRDWPVPPERPRAIQLLTWINENPNIYANPVPVGLQTDFSTPQQRHKYDNQLLLLTWVNQNPNLYTNPVPVIGKVDFSTPPQTYKYDPSLLTCVTGNPGIYTPAQIPPPPTYDWATPPQAYRYDPTLLTWINTNTSLFPPPPVPPPPVVDWPVPMTLVYPHHLRTWTAGNLNLYNNTAPFAQYDWPTPPPRAYSDALRTSISPKPPGFINPIPAQQYDWPTPPFVSSAYTWTPPNLSLYVTPPPPPSAPSTKLFLGEVQQLGNSAILDSSMGIA